MLDVNNFSLKNPALELAFAITTVLQIQWLIELTTQILVGLTSVHQK